MTAVETFKEILKLLEPHYEVMYLNPPAKEFELKTLEHYIGFELPEDFKSIYRLHNGEYQPMPRRKDYSYIENKANEKRNWFNSLFRQNNPSTFDIEEQYHIDFDIALKKHLNLFCGYQFLSVQGMLIQYWDWKHIYDSWNIEEDFGTEDYVSIPKNTIENVYVKAGWLPFATSNTAHLAIDFSPDVDGISGQIINFGRDDYKHYQIATNFTGFLEFVLSQYQQNNFHAKLDIEGEDYLSLYDGLADIIK